MDSYGTQGTPDDPVSYIGLLPTDYYPSNVATVGDQIVVTNTRGIDARGPAMTTYKGEGTEPVSGHDTHSTTASLTRFTLPSDPDIARDTRVVPQGRLCGVADRDWDHRHDGAACLRESHKPPGALVPYLQAYSAQAIP
jgi:hypothetical protein